MRKITIAIDGYSSCGKSTIAKALAAILGYAYIDSGAMYRAVTLYCLNTGIMKDGEVDKDNLIHELDNINVSFKYNEELKSSETFLNGENVEKEIRMMPVSESVSKVSLIKEVRKKLIAIQRQLGKEKGVVMEGRDIGTAVFPDADLKLFMTADPKVRAMRRYRELLEKGTPTNMEEVENNIRQRDHNDTSRDENPLVKAEDAIVLDNTHLNQQEQLDFVMHIVTRLKIYD